MNTKMHSTTPLSDLQLYFQQLCNGPLEELAHCREVVSSQLDKSVLLRAIPSTNTPSFKPLLLLHTLLTEVDGPWPTLELIRTTAKLTKCFPTFDSDDSPNFSWLPEAVTKLVKQSYRSFSNFLGADSRPALRTPNSRNFITHGGLRTFVKGFQLPVKATHWKPRVAIALPNGPLLAAACIAVTTYYTAAPINAAVGPEQFKADVLQSGATFILTTSEEYDKLELRTWIADHGIEAGILDWRDGDHINLRKIDGSLFSNVTAPEPNTPDDIALILFTSGTSGTKKVVPLTVHSLVAGVTFVVDSWGLTATDVCLNMMPLYHVGGLVRNIFAPIFSGGSTVCCSAFDPNMFWDVVHDIQPTWYYASPSMHSVILSEASNRPEALQRSRIRLVCNAAGGLLPSLAHQIRDTFNCVVLPSYGMTECMPISTPPLDYRLEREGTSGISTGPELTILDWLDRRVPSGKVGRICVKGEPIFHGYLRPDGSLDRSPFNDEGWFDTGDLGYMDEDSYLYITGRSKEVINRGGELISPFEVENAILSASLAPGTPITGRVSHVLAFSASHAVLQEVVAVVLVTPPQAPRVDLRLIKEALGSSLQQAKWPVAIVYMDDLPKRNNKVLRIKLGQRLALPEMTDDMPYSKRHWEATCPPPDTAISEPISSSSCTINYTAISTSLRMETPQGLHSHFRASPNDEEIQIFLAPSRHQMEDIDPKLAAKFRSALSKTLHNYMIPDQINFMHHPFPLRADGRIDNDKLTTALDEMRNASLEKLTATIEGRVAKSFADVLGCHPDEVPPNKDFFSLGGDSLRAGRLVSTLRSEFNVPISINLIFSHGTVKALASHIEDAAESVMDEDPKGVAGCSETRSSTNPFLMLLQLIPLVIAYPARRALQWTIFMVALSYTQTWPTHHSVAGRLFNLTLSILFGRVLIRCITPLVGILAKWLIIGRYREGLYPMWGWYHTRWWLVQKLVSICGKGFFGVNESTKRVYYRLMGARIGNGVKLNGVSLGEWDLLDIRDGATLTRCTCRPFAAEGNTSMYLGRIVIGENSSVGTSSIVAAGAVIPPNTCIGPNSSSWELDDADEANRGLSGSTPKPHWLLNCLFTIPLSIIIWFASIMPWLGGLVGMVINQPLSNTSLLRGVLHWFTDPSRVGYHYLALVLRCLFSPFILFACAIGVKFVLDLLFGRLEAGPASTRGTIATWRAALMKTVMSVPRLHDMTGMFGQHYEATSIAVRMLGGKIGKRVYWPGTGPSIGDYHLLDIGDDVVFGSRAHLITSDQTGSEKITIRDRAMIADRVCLLPGVEVSEKTTMGSGALTRRGQSYAAGGTYVGSKGGDAVCLSTGRAEPEKRQTQVLYQPMGSEVTLTEDRRNAFKKKPRGVIRHMSSEDTLAAPRRELRQPSLATISDSDSDTAYRASEPDSDASPFGRAFYMKLAPYYVMGPFAIFCYSSFLTVFTKFYWNVPNISSIQVVDVIFSHFMPDGISMWYDVLALWLMTTFVIAILTTVQAMAALVIVIAAKWILLGRRKPGNYDWDKSSYCQRWQLFLSIEKLRRHCYGGQGVLGMLTGTHWIVLYFKALGAKIGKDCSLFANGHPSLMFTEPDLISLGDRVTVDDASVVAHINTRGKFDLNRLEIGDRCVLRTGSRLLSGATMKDDSCLLEHTLIMGGDVVEAKWTMQGWPAERFKGQRVTR